MPSKVEWTVSILLPLQLTWCASYFLKEDKESHGRHPSCTLLFLLYLFLDASYSQLFHTLLLTPARYIASLLPGAKVPPWDREEEWRKQEEESNDESILWPNEEALTRLPCDWVVNRYDNTIKCKMDASNKDGGRTQKKRARRDIKDKHQSNANQMNSERTQPYFLNHARGSTRIRHASQRVSAALGTVSSTIILCSFASSFLTLKDIGIDTTSRDVLFDLCCGFFVGVFIVSFVFIVELTLCWVKVVGYFDTVSPEEIFLVNFIWDVLFHVGVSINEEIMLRGWMFVLSARGIQMTAAEWLSDGNNTGTTTFAIMMAILLQSTFFAMMHYHSPGSTVISLVNLFIGGIAASFNFLVADGTLWLGIGWHFGWNIMMGHILGRSTSGIPMSCAAINVVPRPLISTPDSKNDMKKTMNTHKSYDKLHGGTFGPEQGPIAPIAYLMGMCVVGYIYGLDGLLAFVKKETI